MKPYSNKRTFRHALLATLLALCGSCDSYLLVDPPTDKISSALVFENDDAAKSAITGIYSRMVTSGANSGGTGSITHVAGLSSDEFIGYNSDYDVYYKNTLLAFGLSSLAWGQNYQFIYTCNAILEELSNTNKVSPSVAKQLAGEAKFIRAFCYFYLTNLYGDVPLHLSTDYRLNSTGARISQAKLYEQIIADLIDAQNLLDNTYYTTERVRPNKWAATALLARVYLYSKNYLGAEIQSNAIITNVAQYMLETDLDKVFLRNSTETIWQLMPNVAGLNTNEGSLFILLNTPVYVSVSESLINAFEPGDKRKTLWTRSLTVGAKTYYYPFKYKIRTSATPTEYSMVLRLAEQYLIRAEARINQDKVADGIKDLNTLRSRARTTPTTPLPNPLPPLPLDLNKPDALLAVEKERQIELFSEWGHRWLDLKRTGRAPSILSILKGNTWQNTDVLWPIPENEISNNSSITQNTGY